MAADGGPLRDQQLPLEELDPHPIISDAKPHICWEKVNEDIWNDIKPIYEDLNQQRLSIEQAEEAFVSSLVSHLFKHGALKTKLPRTNQNKRTRIQSDLKTIQRLKLAKNLARKNLHRGPSTFFNSVRVHNKIIRQQARITAQRNLLAEEMKFRANRFDFARVVCQRQDQNNPTFSASECYTHFSNQFSNANCTYTCLPSWVVDIMPIRVEDPFDCSPVLPRHVKAALKRCSSNSKPGANGISYYHLKNLPCTHLFLASLYSKVLLLSNAAPPSWCMGKIVLTHKDGPNSDPSNFHPIALTSTIGKIFHKILASRLETFLRKNSIIDTTAQKGFLTGMNGVMEHIAATTAIIENARSTQRRYISLFLTSLMPLDLSATSSSTTCWSMPNYHLQSLNTSKTCTPSYRPLYRLLTGALTHLQFNAECSRGTCYRQSSSYSVLTL